MNKISAELVRQLRDMLQIKVLLEEQESSEEANKVVGYLEEEIKRNLLDIIHNENLRG
jgi:hypothetical protein